MTRKFSGILIAILSATLTACSLGGDLDSVHKQFLESKTFTVTFNLNGGEGTAPSPKTVNGGSSVTLPDDSGFSLEGCTFSGWNTKSNGTGTSYNAGNKHTLTSNVTMYAQWIETGTTTYTVTFDLNGGAGEKPPAQTVNNGESVTLPDAFFREGYTFGDWNTEPDGTGLTYKARDSYKPTGNVTLYARWQYTVTFNINDGTGTTPEPQTVNIGESVTIPDGSGLSRSGYTFAGWNTASDGTGTNYDTGEHTLPGNVILYAIWFVEPEMVQVAGGSFAMGDIGDGAPSHTVSVSGFLMGKYEVTQTEWMEIMGSNPGSFEGESLPVENITWYDAVEFCNRLSEQAGLTPVYTISGRTFDSGSITSAMVIADWSANGYRLPTEAEWEYAARGGNGSPGTFEYSGSDSAGEVAWSRENSDNTIHAVGTKTANGLGLFDMSGNVYEWCWDWYEDYSNEHQTNPLGASGGTRRIVRGGSWNASVDSASSGHRSNLTPGSRNNDLGFRLVRSVRETVTVTFDINEGEGTPPPAQTATSGESITLPDRSSFSLSGYTFAGWR
ncbi:MAG TPA: hypothetical protein DEQ14_08085, partial [Treponema sp.]|nr:hypothetical protein [Treponema sp.]